MPKFDDPFVSYYELERANLLEQLERMQTGAWKILDHSVDITPERIDNTVERLATTRLPTRLRPGRARRVES